MPTPNDLADELIAASLGIARPISAGLDATPDAIVNPSVAPPVSYEAASMQHRLSPWRPNRAHINSILAAEGATLRARSRQIIANSPYGANSSEVFTGYATGTGIHPSSLIEDEDRKAELEDLWLGWTDESDADGMTDFYGQQSLVARGVFDAGDVFGRLRPRYMSDGLSVPLQVQLLEAEQLDDSYQTQLSSGNVIRSGIEFNAIGKRAAYWFWRNHPGDGTVVMGNERVRVPAESVVHVYKPLRPGQLRGRPWLTPAMVKLYDLDQYEDAELSRKKCAAMFMAFITKSLNPDAALPLPGTDPSGAAAQANLAGLANLMMEPNIMQVLPEGTDIKFSEPADVGPNFESFIVRTLYAVCAAIGLPYHNVTSDVSKANYSSLRAALIALRPRIEQFQHETLVFQFCRPIFWAWLDAAVTAGAIRLQGYATKRTYYRKVRWMTPPWEWVNPVDDIRAESMAVDAGFQPRSDVIERRYGEDAIATDRRIAAEHERERRLDLKFKQSPASGGQGQQQPKPQNNGVVDANDGNSTPPPADGQEEAAA